MKTCIINLRFAKKTFAAFVAMVLVLGFGSAALAQPYPPTVTQQAQCFTISIAPTDDTQCGHVTPCGSPSMDTYCDHCYEVTITNDQCPGLVIFSINMTTTLDNTDDCRALCSDDFDIPNPSPEGTCSWYGPRTLTYTGNGGLGLAYGMSATFYLCRVYDELNTTSSDYTFDCGACSCNGLPCNGSAVIHVGQ